MPRTKLARNMHYEVQRSLITNTVEQWIYTDNNNECNLPLVRVVLYCIVCYVPIAFLRNDSNPFPAIRHPCFFQIHGMRARSPLNPTMVLFSFHTFNNPKSNLVQNRLQEVCTERNSNYTLNCWNHEQSQCTKKKNRSNRPSR